MDVFPPQEQSVPRSSHRGLIAVLLLIMLFLIGARFSPWCITSAGITGWKTWTRVYPNLACSLDLHAEQVSAEELDARLGSFANITHLDLSAMQLTEVPAGIASITKVTTMTLSKNSLTEVPDSLALLPSLTKLDLSSNAITQVSGALGGSPHLVSLDLSDNEISSVPSFLNSSSFSSLSLGQNPLSPNEQGSGEGQSSSVAESSSSAASSSSAVAGVSSASVSSSDSSAAIISSSAEQSSTSSVLPVASSSEISSGTSSSSAGIDISSFASSSNSSVTSVEQGVSCTRNFSINTYSMCIPSSWTVQQIDPLHVNLFQGSTLVAKAECPMEQATYDTWDLSLRSRTFQKNESTYGADELSGEDKTSGQMGLLLVFMHKHDFNSWFGDSYADVTASCQIQSLNPNEDANVMRLLYLSVQ